MERDGNLKRFYELSRTTRYRIRKMMKHGFFDDGSSSDDDVLDEAQRPHHVRRRPLLGAEDRGQTGSSEGEDERQAPPVAHINYERNNSSSTSSEGENGYHTPPENNSDDQNDNTNAGADLQESPRQSSDEGVQSEQDQQRESDNEIEAREEGNNSAHDQSISEESGRASDEEIENNEDSDHEQDDFDWDRDDDETLYGGAPITVGESMLAILSFMLRYRLSRTCVSDLLLLISMHCKQEGNRCRKTFWQFQKFFENVQYPMERQYYCSACFNSVTGVHDVCNVCRRDWGKGFFIEIPVINQLRGFFKRPGFTDSLSHRFTRRKRNPDNYEDIYDGTVYKELSTGVDGILSNPNNISFMWNSDGVSVFKSSRYEIWPFYLTINELPYNQRARLSNTLLAGLWFGQSKPVPNLFLENISNDLLLLKNGIRFSTAKQNEKIFVRGIVIGGTCDLPAKAKFLNFKQFNSQYGCSRCEIQTINIDRGLNVYPFRQNLHLRTDEETLRYAAEAVGLPLFQGDRQAVKGVKGPTILSQFVYQCVRTTAVDSMHCVFLGVMRSQLHLWFSTNNNEKDFSLSGSFRLINQRLCAFTPPSFVQRLPRSLKDLKYWKAHEFKVFLFYYSIPILEGTMKEIYFNHYVLFVHAIYMLCQSSISEEMLQLAEDLLREYVSQYETLYGLENMTCNVHSLLHLTDTVRMFGPLFISSCFGLEDLNGRLKSLIHGTKYAELQVYSGVSMYFKSLELKNDLQEGDVSRFCDRLAESHRNLKRTLISERMWILGAYKKVNVMEETVQQAVRHSNLDGVNFYSFLRLLKHNIVYGSECYNRSTRTNSSYIKYMFEDRMCIGVVHSYIRCTTCMCENFCHGCDARYYAIVRKCITYHVSSPWPDEELHFMHRVIGHADVAAVEIDNIISMCFVANVTDNNKTYVIEAVNLVEAE